MKIIKRLILFLESRWFIVFICLLLGSIPFFWFKPGYIDIGGDSSRLYFYDPISFLRSFVLNIFLPDTLGIKSGGAHMMPFISLLAVFHFIFHSPWLVNNLVNSISLVIPFLIIYAIVTEFIRDFHKKRSKSQDLNIRYSSILAGLFYVLIPVSSMEGWDLPLIIHTQRFVYPLLFWLLLKFFTTSKSLFLVVALLISFLFAQNFSWVSVPNFLGFFSVSLLYIWMYMKFIKKKTVSLKPLLFALLLFVLLHSFHLLPLFSNILEKNSDVSNQLLQGSKYADTVHYLDSVASYTERGNQFIGITPFSPLTTLNITLIIFPLLIVFMLLKNKNIRLLLPITFFLLLYFIITAKITHIGFVLFKKAFLIPQLVMFRDFYGRLFDIFLLFYAFLIGYALFSLSSSLKSYQKLIFACFLVCILIVNTLPFITGKISNRILTQDTGVVVRSSSAVDPHVEDILKYFRNDSFSGRNITLPIADFDYQILAGKANDGAYFGPSMIAYLTGKNDLASSFTLRPFTPALFNSIKNKDYVTFENIFPILGVRTVLHNANPYIYEVFATFPYNDAKLYMPKTQTGYTELIDDFSLEKVYDFGKYYHLYKVAPSLNLPILYPADKIILYEQKTTSNFDENNYNSAEYVLKNFRIDKNDTVLRKVFLNKNVKVSKISQPTISFSKINNSKYILSMENVEKPYVLVFSQSFSTNWKLFEANQTVAKKEMNKKVIESYFNKSILEKKSENGFIDINMLQTIGKKPLAESRHFLANAYANAWYILPSDVPHKTKYTLILEMTDQRFVSAGIFISFIGLCISFAWLIREVVIYFRKSYD